MNTTESKYEINLYWDAEDEIFIAEVPELPGCMAHGSTKARALKSAEESVAFWIKTAVDDGIPIPKPKGKLIYA